MDEPSAQTPPAGIPNRNRRTDPDTDRGSKPKGKGRPSNGKGKPSTSTKLRGLEKDSPQVRTSKTLSWLLRHGATGEGLKIRPDGYVKVTELLAHPKLKGVSLDLAGLQEIVKADAKKRYDLVLELDANAADGGSSGEASSSGCWWIKANQGHSMKVQLELKPITSLAEIPAGIAVHGTTEKAWPSISTQGLSKMKRNHIHLAQGIAGRHVVSGMRTSSQILIFVDVQKALDAGIKFFLSDNGVVLTEGDANGFLSPEFFSRVENSKRQPLEGWEGSGPPAPTPIEGAPSGGYETPQEPTQRDSKDHIQFTI